MRKIMYFLSLVTVDMPIGGYREIKLRSNVSSSVSKDPACFDHVLHRIEARRFFIRYIRTYVNANPHISGDIDLPPTLPI